MGRILFLGAVLSVPALSVAQASGAATPAVSQPAPYFALYNSSGEALVSLSDFVVVQGKAKPHKKRRAVLLDFFRTDCKPCVKGLPKLAALHKSHKAKGVEVLLIALLEQDEGEEKLDKFLKANPQPFTVLVDAYGVVAKKYVRKGNGFQIPQLFVIDGDGKLKGRGPSLEGKEGQDLFKVLTSLVKQ